MPFTDGVINFNKPVGITSAKALYRIRRIIGVRKSGHAGTLDPAAEGVLVICVGKATKLVELVMAQPKVYRTTARLDVTSSSFDSDAPLIPVASAVQPDRTAVLEALNSFEGAIEQTPPAISALKIGGVPAYKLARSGTTPVLKPRPVTVHWTHLHGYDWPNVDFEIACSRGTYIRSIIRDLGQTLGTGGCLTSLKRLAVGPFHIDRARTFENLETQAPAECILPLAQVRDALEAGEAPVPPRPTA